MKREAHETPTEKGTDTCSVWVYCACLCGTHTEIGMPDHWQPPEAVVREWTWYADGHEPGAPLLNPRSRYKLTLACACGDDSCHQTIDVETPSLGPGIVDTPIPFGTWTWYAMGHESDDLDDDAKHEHPWKMDVSGGEVIDHAARRAIRLAKQVGRAVQFTFNGTEVLVSGSDTPASVVERYYRDREARRVESKQPEREVPLPYGFCDHDYRVGNCYGLTGMASTRRVLSVICRKCGDHKAVERGD